METAPVTVTFLHSVTFAWAFACPTAGPASWSRLIASVPLSLSLLAASCSVPPEGPAPRAPFHSLCAHTLLSSSALGRACVLPTARAEALHRGTAVVTGLWGARGQMGPREGFCGGSGILRGAETRVPPGKTRRARRAHSLRDPLLEAPRCTGFVFRCVLCYLDFMQKSAKTLA